MLQWQKDNKELVNKRNKKWRFENKEKVSNSNKQWRAKNKSYILFRNSNRKLYIKQATPLWANMDAIKLEYDLAIWCSQVTGIAYHVDHVVPLRGKNVCGLHVHNNLQVIPATDNLSKSNFFTV